MSLGSRIVTGSIDRHRTVTVVIVAMTIVIALAAGLPSVFPQTFGFLSGIKVDTDPENMLSEHEAVRVFHDRMKRAMDLYDMVVVGVVNESDPDGVFNPQTLARVHELTEYAKGLSGAELGEPPGQGVVAKDIIAPSTVDNLEPGSAGVSFSWLMPQPPETREQARKVRDAAKRIPFLNGTMVADKPGKEGKAVAIYLPLTRKDLSYKVYTKLKEKIATLTGPEKYYITGLPVAEDTFGVEMFIQMAISAPAAMLVIFLLMLAFFRKLVIVISPMIVAMVSVVLTMGMLIVAGFPIHIMSSMIPIFIMPIAVLDSIHIISEFFEKYQATRDRRKTILAVMDDLFMPMLYTSLTSAAGFASLALTPIPPVQVFGIFVAAGIMVAWLLTITFVPAYIMFISPKTLENFGAAHDHEAGEAAHTRMSRVLRWIGGATYRRAKPILAVAMVVLAVAGYGISRIVINDNPVKWFTPSHDIRVADKVLNEHFGGTYMAYLAVSTVEDPWNAAAFAQDFAEGARREGESLKADMPAAEAVFAELAALARRESAGAGSRDAFFAAVTAAVEKRTAPRAPTAPAKPPSKPGGEPGLPGGLTDEPGLPGGLDEKPTTRPATRPADTGDRDAETWAAAALFVDRRRQAHETFKDPKALNWLGEFQTALEAEDIVGKSNSLGDIVKTVRRDFVSGKKADYRIPKTREGVAQMLIQYQSSHRKDDLWHFVTPDYRTTSVWLQLTSGDNRDMSRVVAAAEKFVRDNPPPLRLKHDWFGLTYINVKWQDKMVTGMAGAFAGSFLVVFLLMTIMFRSALWGLLSMIPLTVTIAAIYGAVGLIGKDYDMPVAVLSSLTLGLAVDFAIHFLARSRAIRAEAGSWRAAAPGVFGEPARAITRNIIVIAAGFLPLLLAPLVPYKTVGILLATILLVSGLATLLLLPALIRLLEGRLFKAGQPLGATCNCVTCGVSSLAVVALILISIHPYAQLQWTTLTIIAAAAVPAGALLCGLLSRRDKCKIQTQAAESDSA